VNDLCHDYSIPVVATSHLANSQKYPAGACCENSGPRTTQRISPILPSTSPVLLSGKFDTAQTPSLSTFCCTGPCSVLDFEEIALSIFSYCAGRARRRQWIRLRCVICANISMVSECKHSCWIHGRAKRQLQDTPISSGFFLASQKSHHNRGCYKICANNVI
jgi:hypothetical protein